MSLQLYSFAKDVDGKQVRLKEIEYIPGCYIIVKYIDQIFGFDQYIL